LRAVKAGYEISVEVGDKVKHAAIGIIGGVKVVLEEPFHKK
jgi:hypothetical protein